jgi:hypothetical protein
MKLIGLKKVCGEINRNRRLYCRVMFDTADKRLWIDVFPDCNSWNEYRANTIYNVANIEQGIFDDYRHITQAEIRLEIEQYLAERGVA